MDCNLAVFEARVKGHDHNDQRFRRFFRTAAAKEAGMLTVTYKQQHDACIELQFD